MLLFETLAVLALWLAFVWIYDPDGFRVARKSTLPLEAAPLSSTSANNAGFDVPRVL